ncbi:MAG: zinc-ribbon domain-containing protein [Lachnospiraceae bacterium]|nr:zinc-ribbon domain-containing protein [Lachnospiraceae bacterium]
MFCGKCGSKINDNSKFCPVCGERQGDAASESYKPVGIAEDYVDDIFGRSDKPAPSPGVVRVNGVEQKTPVKPLGTEPRINEKVKAAAAAVDPGVNYGDYSTFSTASGRKGLKYVVIQVTLKEKFLGTGSGNLTELEDCINAQAAKGYRLHTISTANGGSKGLMGGDRIQATMVFERID